jgi:hypothetical protein
MDRNEQHKSGQLAAPRVQLAVRYPTGAERLENVGLFFSLFVLFFFLFIIYKRARPNSREFQPICVEMIHFLFLLLHCFSFSNC